LHQANGGANGFVNGVKVFNSFVEFMSILMIMLEVLIILALNQGNRHVSLLEKPAHPQVGLSAICVANVNSTTWSG